LRKSTVVAEHFLQTESTLLDTTSVAYNLYLLNYVHIKDNLLIKMWSRIKNYVNDVRENLPAYQERLSQQVSSWKGGDECLYEEITLGNKRIRLLKKIAEGGYSCIFLGEEVVVGGPPQQFSAGSSSPKYAIKRIGCGGKEQYEEALKEIRVMKLLNHPNILPILGDTVVQAKPGSGPVAQHVYMLFDLYDGNVWDVVQSRMQVGRPLRESEVESVFRQLIHALFAMQEADMSHMDVKPHNIMLKNTESYPYGKWSDISKSPAVLMDFGSVKPASQQISSRGDALHVQEDAERYTTAPYRAPELWDVPSNCIIDGKVDVWAAGCVLYYLFVGETPFERTANEAGGSLMLSILKCVILEPVLVHVYIILTVTCRLKMQWIIFMALKSPCSHKV